MTARTTTQGEHMDPELAALAAAGATTLVQQMVGDGWAQVRDRLARVFSRGSGGETGDGETARTVRGELDLSREELVAARAGGDHDAADDVQAAWRSRLRRTLRADPAFAAELRALVDELTPPEETSRGGNTYNTINGGAHGIVVQAGSVGGSVRSMYGSTPPAQAGDTTPR
ncbi:hypothetical protein [Streptomyces sp. TS71-3]|uniref:hypothetical protein n=1 Tax=Streptomyces sp. TS71-3 TaxID=2733862 RepID=UPI001AFEB9B8|nr:hypothetical protein [Streptomyces sp. TS71-3]GHJ38310.1 hypothetical protein Sm713_39190 [Streptomyces sp. TS71-3]